MNLYAKRIPISGERGLCAVPGYDPIDLSRVTPPEPPYDYRITGLVTSQLDVSFAASLNFPGSFVAELQGDMMFFLLELMALLPETPDESGQFRGLVWGVGLRMGIATTKIDAKLASSIAGVAASASLKTSTSSRYTLAPGLGHEVLKRAGKFFANVSGTFDAAQMQDLGQGLQDISQYLVTDAKKLAPVAVYTIAETPKEDIAKIQSVSAVYALNAIRQGWSYKQAEANLARTSGSEGLVNLFDVMAIYQEIVNNAGTDPPGDTQRALANAIYNLRGNY